MPIKQSIHASRASNTANNRECTIAYRNSSTHYHGQICSGQVARLSSTSSRLLDKFHCSGKLSLVQHRLISYLYLSKAYRIYLQGLQDALRWNRAYILKRIARWRIFTVLWKGFFSRGAYRGLKGASGRLYFAFRSVSVFSLRSEKTLAILVRHHQFIQCI